MYRYWCSGSDMSADMKRMTKRVRKARPDFFAPKDVRSSTMSDEGKVSVSINRDVKATPMTGAARHRISLQRETY